LRVAIPEGSFRHRRSNWPRFRSELPRIDGDVSRFRSASQGEFVSVMGLFPTLIWSTTRSSRSLDGAPNKGCSEQRLPSLQHRHFRDNRDERIRSGQVH
jgi:hypothetical protein